MLETTVTFANENGYSFTLAELEAYEREMHILSDKQLDQISGGEFDTCLCALSGHEHDEDYNCACVVYGAGRKTVRVSARIV